jgi:hypothetical protein
MIKKNASHEKGQSLVEFALSATILMFLLLAVSDFGLAFLSWITLRDAAQEGATYAAVYPPVDTTAPIRHTTEGFSLIYIRARVRESATLPVSLTNLPTSHININLLQPDGNAGGLPCQGNAIQVTVTYDYHFISPMGKIFGNAQGEIPISANVTNTILVDGDKTVCN